jgi:hypothetical protein
MQSGVARRPLDLADYRRRLEETASEIAHL